jgi:hypothetical protein
MVSTKRIGGHQSRWDVSDGSSWSAPVDGRTEAADRRGDEGALALWCRWWPGGTTSTRISCSSGSAMTRQADLWWRQSGAPAARRRPWSGAPGLCNPVNKSRSRPASRPEVAHRARVCCPDRSVRLSEPPGPGLRASLTHSPPGLCPSLRAVRESRRCSGNPAVRQQLHALTNALARAIAGVAGGPAINRRAPAAGVWAICGVTWRSRSSMTKSLASNPRSAASVIGPKVGSRSSMASATSRSAWPEARVSSASTTSPCRFSISTCPTKQSFASWPGPLRYSRASGSVIEAWLSVVRRSPWKSRS